MKDLAKQLKISEERLRVALKDSAITLSELDSNLEYKWVYNSKDAKTPEVVGEKVGESGNVRDRTPLRDFYLDVLRSGEPKRSEIPLNCFGKMGYYAVYAEPLRDTKGNIIGLMSASTNISQAKEAELALRESEHRFRLVAEAAGVLVYEFDPKTNVAKIYRGEDVLGFNQSELLLSFEWWMAQIHPDDRVAIEKKWNTAVEKGVDVLLQYRYRRKQGDYIIVHDLLKMVKDPEGKVIRVVGGLSDVTERKKAEQRLEDYNYHLEKIVEERTKQLKAQERLAAIGATAGMVGHDIRNPLQAMLGDVYLLKEALTLMPAMKTKDEVTESLEGLEKNISYVNKIVADLQDYARPLNPECSTVNLTDVITRVLDTIELPDDVKLSVELKTFPKIKTEPTYIQRSITNLVNNALQAMPKGGHLTINVFERNGRAVITVADTGVGIPDDVKPKLFSPMMTTKSKGQGLGLAVVKRLIEAIGGFVSFESKVGKGTKFFVELPLPRTC